VTDPLEAIVAEDNHEQAKELLRLLVKDIHVHDRRRIVPTYRVPAAVRAMPSKVGGTGLEPVTPSLSNSSVASAAETDPLRKTLLSRHFLWLGRPRTCGEMRRSAHLVWGVCGMGGVARFANGQRPPHLGCICVFASLPFAGVGRC